MRNFFCLLSLDPADACERCVDLGQCQSCRSYQSGAYGPRFPVPSTIHAVGYLPEDCYGQPPYNQQCWVIPTHEYLLIYYKGYEPMRF